MVLFNLAMGIYVITFLKIKNCQKPVLYPVIVLCAEGIIKIYVFKKFNLVQIRPKKHFVGIPPQTRLFLLA